MMIQRIKPAIMSLSWLSRCYWDLWPLNPGDGTFDQGREGLFESVFGEDCLGCKFLCGAFFSFLKFCTKTLRHFPTFIKSRVPDQNGVSQAWYIVEIHHSGGELLKYKLIQKASSVLGEWGGGGGAMFLNTMWQCLCHSWLEFLCLFWPCFDVNMHFGLAWENLCLLVAFCFPFFHRAWLFVFEYFSTDQFKLEQNSFAVSGMVCWTNFLRAEVRFVCWLVA